jgi:hypothetical protein
VSCGGRSDSRFQRPAAFSTAGSACLTYHRRQTTRRALGPWFQRRS